MALHAAALRADLRELREWLSNAGVGGDPLVSWRAWWEAGTPPAAAHGTPTLLGQALMATVYAYIAGGLLLYSDTEADGSIANAFDANSLWQLALSAAVVAPAMVLAAFDSFAGPRVRRWRTPLMLLLLVGSLCWVVWVTQSVSVLREYLAQRVAAGHWAGWLAPTFYALPTLINHTLTCFFGLAGIGCVLTIAQAHLRPARDALRWLHRTRDYLLLATMTWPLALLALLLLPQLLQTRLVFQPSGFFFSDTPRGRSWCLCSCAAFTLLVLLWSAYMVLWFLGYFPAPPLFFLQC